MRRSRMLFVVPAALAAALAGGFAAEGDESGPPARLVPVQSLPPVSTPSVSVPDTPAVQTPNVPAVPVNTPDVPAVQTPHIPSTSTPSIPSVPSVPNLGSGGGSGSGGRFGSATSGGSYGGRTGAGSGGSSGGGASTSGSATSHSAGGTKAARSVAPKTAAQRRRAREKRFRARVERLQGCLGVLSDSERQVIELRAGLGGKDPRSVGQVAQDLGVSRGRVSSTQRKALRRLGRANRSTGCGAPAAGVAPVSGGTGARAAFLKLASAAMPRLQPAVLLTEQGLVPASVLASGDGSGSGSDRGHGDVRGAEASGGSDSGT